MHTARIAAPFVICALLLGCSAADRQAERGNALPVLQGIWHMEADTPSGQHEATMFVVQEGPGISGRFEGALGIMHYSGTVTANEVRFSHPAMAGAMHFDYTGTVSGDAMKGTAVFGTLGTGTWTAMRVKNQ